MKNIKFILVLLVIFIVVLITILIITKNNKDPEIVYTEKDIEEMKKEMPIESTNKVNDINSYIKVRNCANIYLSEININNSSYFGHDESGNYINLASENDINNYMYQVLSKEYINKNSITLDNIRSFVYRIEEECFYVPIEVYEKGNTENVKSYGVYGVILTQEFKPIEDSYIIINIDNINNTFSVEQLKGRDELESIVVNTPNEIEQKDNNVIPNIVLTDEEVIKAYINDYKRLALAYPEIAYNVLLDEEYKNRRFDSVKNFKEYVNQNKEEIISINPVEYLVYEENEYNQYIVKDSNNKYYIINAENPSNYRIMLDMYTIDIPQFIDKYNNGTEQEKVALNIDKFVQSINNSDYKYAYSCLADSFKNNYFKTQEEFEIYAKESFYSNSRVEYKDFNVQGDLYTYIVVLTNTATNEQMTKTFIVQLDEGTDFKLSFNR